MIEAQVLSVPWQRVRNHFAGKEKLPKFTVNSVAVSWDAVRICRVLSLNVERYRYFIYVYFKYGFAFAGPSLFLRRKKHEKGFT